MLKMFFLGSRSSSLPGGQVIVNQPNPRIELVIKERPRIELQLKCKGSS